jgi:putative FmdB family regulatory protein
MPLYEYECLKCGRRTERIESVRGPHLKQCPRCKGKVERVIAPPAIQFKGSGWYVTDYAGKGGASDGSKAEKPESKKAGEAKQTKDAAEAKEKKGAKKD